MPRRLETCSPRRSLSTEVIPARENKVGVADVSQNAGRSGRYGPGWNDHAAHNLSQDLLNSFTTQRASIPVVVTQRLQRLAWDPLLESKVIAISLNNTETSLTVLVRRPVERMSRLRPLLQEGDSVISPTCAHHTNRQRPQNDNR